MNALLLQVKYSHLAREWRPVLEAKVHPVNPHTSDEERAIVLMELIYRTMGARPGYAALCWALVFGESRPYPVGLIAPSDDLKMTDARREVVMQARWADMSTCGRA